MSEKNRNNEKENNQEKVSRDPSGKPKSPQKSVRTIRLGKMEFRLPYEGLLPPLPKEKYDALSDDVAVNGVMVPVIIDEHGNVIEGNTRVKIVASLGHTDIPFQVRPGLTEEEKRQLALDLNLHRRHLKPEEMQEIAVRLRQEGMSLRQIAEQLGISHETVRRHLGTVTNETVELPETIKGKDGKVRKAKLERKRHPFINARSVSEAAKVTEACKRVDMGKLPPKGLDVKGITKYERLAKADTRRKEQYEDLSLSQATLLLGDFRERGKNIASDSIDMIFTDPPYDKKSLPLWQDLGELAHRVLKPGGMLLSYSGNMYLPDIHTMLGKPLSYLWTFAIHHTGGTKFLSWVNLRQAWKPLLAYYKPPLQKRWSPFLDMVSGGIAKEHHEWEQAESEAQHYIRALCPPNGTLLDPMMGSGTTLLAALNLNLGIQATGIEIDGAAYGTAQERVRQAEGQASNETHDNETA